MTRPLLLALALTGMVAPAAAQGTPDDIELFVARLEQLATAGDAAGITALRHPDGDVDEIAQFASIFSTAPARAVIKVRDRAPVEDGLQRLLLEVLVERGIEARVSTWRMDLAPSKDVSGEAASAAGETSWLLAGLDRLTMVSGLFRLSLDLTRQFDIRNLTLNGPDLALEIPVGRAFVAEIPDGPTAIVVLGRGRMRFAPQDPAERTQIRIFSGAEALDAEFDAAFVRLRPSEFSVRFRAGALVPRAVVSSSDAGRAQDIFEEYVGRTLHVDLTDLSRDRWSLVPSVGDLIVEVRTRRYGSLTYARAWNDAEDISVFDRRRRRNISVYASAEKLAVRGRFYSEDELVDFDVLDYDLDVSFEPERRWISGAARLTMKVRAPVLTTMTLKLSEALTVRGVYSPEYGRLLHLRVVGQNSVIVNLPAFVTRDSLVRLLVVYSGRLESQELDREAIHISQEREPMIIPLEPRYIYSNRSYWYPQSTVTDYATAQMRITVPAEYDVVASGVPVGEPSPAPGPVEPGSRAPRVFVFVAERPARYLGCVISRLATVTSTELKVPTSPMPLNGQRGQLRSTPGPLFADPDAAKDESVALVVQANPRQAGRARAFAQQAADIIEFYASLVGEAPYPSFTLAVTESDLPGGHSPPYFAVLNQTVMASSTQWRNDPVSFDDYPTFFLAHELAHQWWGQAVGWKNYHEQWISEGFAQYFAALYAEQERGPGTVLSLLRQMRKWAMAESDQGPVYLGYRLGHIRGDSRVFRALIYNKAALTLHMLRRLIGDEAFFAGMRQFYRNWRFQKAGTDDFRTVMESTSHQDLSRFFDAWIYGFAIPHVKFSYSTADPGSMLLRFEHLADVMPVPVTVAITYTDGQTQSLVVPVTERVVERTVQVRAAVRKVEVNHDNAALAEFVR